MKFLRTLAAGKTALLRTIPLMRHERVPLTLKIVTGALAVLVISPLDLFADIPVLGVLDDAMLLSLVCFGFVRVASRYVERVPELVRVRDLRTAR